MAARVSEVEVEEIIEIDSSISATVFITQANLFINETADLDSADYGLSDEILKELERLVAAHFVCQRMRRTVSEGADGINEKFALSVGEGLMRTEYGQDAIALDPTGVLGTLARGSNAAGLIQSVDGIS